MHLCIISGFYLGLTFGGQASVSQFMSAVQDMPVVSYVRTWYHNVYKNTGSACSDVRMCGYVRSRVVGVHI